MIQHKIQIQPKINLKIQTIYKIVQILRQAIIKQEISNRIMKFLTIKYSTKIICKVNPKYLN
jgi:hypothetical protein